MFESNIVPPVVPSEENKIKEQSEVNTQYRLNQPVRQPEVLNPNEQKIRENFVYFGGISLLYGILFTFSLYRNLFGAAFLLYAIATVVVLIMFLNKIELKVKIETKLYFTAVMLCGISTGITSSGVIQFFNWCFIIVLLFMAMIGQFFEDREWNAFSYMRYLPSLFFLTIGSSLRPIQDAKKYFHKEVKGQKKIDKKMIGFVVTGILCAIGALLIIFPLLLSSDMIFNKIFGDMFGIFEISKVLSNLKTEIEICVMVVVGFAAIYAFFYASCHANFPLKPERKMAYCHPAAGIAFSIVIAIVYLVYSEIQIVYLFMGRGLPEGITYSEYARSGFWQLVAVAFINVGMVLVCMYLFKENKWLKWILTVISGCTFIMMLSAAYRMYLYVAVYHLTILRVLVFWALAVLALVMGGVIVSIYSRKFKLITYVIGVVVCGYLVLSFSQPSYWIAKYNISHMEEISYYDICNMMYSLSLDAAPVFAEISSDEIVMEEGMEFQEWEVKSLFYDYFKTISEENEEFSLRTMNISKMRAKRAADEHLERNREIYEGLGVSE